MADAKLTSLTALTTVTGDDLLYAVDDPAGTPASRKVTAKKPKTISKRTWDAILPLERLEAVARQFDDSEDDDEEALLMLL